MYANVMGFVCGVLLLQQRTSILGWGPLWGAAVVAALALAASRRPSACRVLSQIWPLLLAGAVGYGWAFTLAHWRLADELAPALEGQDLRVSGTIASMPVGNDRSVAFDFALDSPPPGVPQRVALRWYAQPDDSGPGRPALAAGQRWTLTVRLKRPHGRLNPQLRDGEVRFLEAGVRAQGYVRAKPPPAALAPAGDAPGIRLEQLRQGIATRLSGALGERRWKGIPLALALGEQSAISQAQWARFRDLGIVHLAVVSGLHVTLVGGLAAALAAWLWGRLGLATRWPSRKAAMPIALLAAWAYALLSGFGIPVQRSVVMLTVLGVCLLGDQRLRASRMLALALGVTVVTDPWAVLAPGFWLSFLAVGVLLLVGLARPAPGGYPARLWQALRAQWLIGVAMVPALLLFFQQVSLVSPIANLIAVPVVGLIVLPLSLLALLLPFDVLPILAERIFATLMGLLEFLEAIGPVAWRQAAPPNALLLPAVLACLWGVLPRGTPARSLALAALVPVLAYQAPRPAVGSYEVVILDVGQGLSVHVRTSAHELLFDSGPRWPEGDAGASVVVPYLRAAGVDSLDLLVSSHPDTDHVGGAQSVAAGIAVRRRVDQPPAAGEATLSGQHAACRAGDGWHWDGVSFLWLSPPAGETSAAGWSRNDRSCSLLISGAGGRTLLTADIEASAEAWLVARGDLPTVDLVVAPHHGSRSSSSPAFVDALRARVVVFPVGYRSRFGHPHPQVWSRWAEAGARAYRTDSQGAIHARFDREGMHVSAERASRERYWQGR